MNYPRAGMSQLKPSADHAMQSAENENAVLGVMISCPESIPHAATLLHRDYFHDEVRGRVFEVLERLHSAGLPVSDAVVLRTKLVDAGLWDEIGGSAGLARLAQSVVTQDINRYAPTIVLLHKTRLLIRAATSAIYQLENARLLLKNTGEQFQRSKRFLTQGSLTQRRASHKRPFKPVKT